MCAPLCLNAGRQLARRLLLELLFGELFCAALSTPERHGVLPLELQLSASARHNLLQVATLLNTVASSTREAAVASSSHELLRCLYERLDWVSMESARLLFSRCSRLHAIILQPVVFVCVTCVSLHSGR